MNWTTGQVSIIPLAIQILSASAFSQFYGPWLISASFPLGAVLFLAYGKKALERDGTDDAPRPTGSASDGPGS